MADEGQKKTPDARSLTAEAIMRKEVITANGGMTVREVIQLFIKNSISAAPVVDASNKLITVVSEFDLMQFAAVGELDVKLSAKLPKLVSTEKVSTVKRVDSLKDLFKSFLAHRHQRVFVVDNAGKLEGIVSRGDVLKMMLDSL